MRLPPPPSFAAAQALAPLNQDYVGQLGAICVHFLHWCVDMFCVYITPNVTNHYIASVSACYSSINHAKRARAMVGWLASMFGYAKPVDALTLKLFYALEKGFSSGARLSLSRPQFLALKSCPKSDVFHSLLLRFLCLSGVRPVELAFLSCSSFSLSASVPKVRTGPTKFRPNGRSVDLSPDAVRVVYDLLPFCSSQSGFLVPSSRAFRLSLQLTLRRLVSSDPSSLPLFTLYCCRHFFASCLWALGVSSAWLMAQLGHRHWATSLGYVHTEDGGVPSWRDSFVSGMIPEGWFGFVPESAKLAPPLQMPGSTARWLKVVCLGGDVDASGSPGLEEGDPDDVLDGVL